MSASCRLFFSKINNISWAALIWQLSGSYCLFKIAGPGARRLLQRGAFIDLHPDAFHADSVATTVIAHIGVTFWQGDSNEAFELLTSRSYAHSFQTWIESVSRTR